MPRCSILYKNQVYSMPSHYLNIPVDNRNRVCLIRVLVDGSLVLFPEYPRPFGMPMKTAPKHPSLLPLMLLHYASGVPFLTRSTCNPSSCVPPASNPSLICPQYLILLRHCPINMLKCPSLAYLSILLRNRGLSHS